MYQTKRVGTRPHWPGGMLLRTSFTAISPGDTMAHNVKDDNGLADFLKPSPPAIGHEQMSTTAKEIEQTVIPVSNFPDIHEYLILSPTNRIFQSLFGVCDTHSPCQQTDAESLLVQTDINPSLCGA